MGTINARAVMEHLGLVSTLFENPEVSAMSAICDILRQLPDDESRLRVMRWSFGRFSPEFKRPLAEIAAPAIAPLAAPAADPVDLQREIAAIAPEMIAAAPPPPRRETDFGRELSELVDLFPPQRRQHAAADGPPINLDAF